MFDPAKIESLIQTALPGATVAVRDTAGDSNHFEATVIASQFEGVSLVKRHQLVFAALGGAMVDEKIHALQLKTLTPAQWQQSPGT